ncbi:nitrate- and nitrite sensing domain-containing protein [Streptomyces lichenis]|uniref:histidine kinase n=1 Tax=Streptomyces lichenis TaxID=2306967 RepID=A0ABT0IJ47_9ACTN|nr:nitrate- and nitrite sensing domain-containing protein [Streptomyces lichenis]MCK8681356.1 nitrate- and nitrite sensing domain-containing protein [Streptomyces lichenis]
MRFRGKSIRRKIVALLLVPLVSLTGLWAFSTMLTARQADQLLDVGHVVDKIGYPLEATVRDIQDERRQTLVYLADPRGAEALPRLRAERAATDRGIARIRTNARDAGVADTLDGRPARRLDALLTALDEITALRRSVDNRAVGRLQALQFYNRLIDPCYGFLAGLTALEDVELEQQARGLVGVVRARELLAREDALVASSLLSERTTPAELRAVSDLVAQRKLLYELSLEQLPSSERQVLRAYWGGPDTGPLREAENALLGPGPDKARSTLTAGRWQELATPVLDRLATENTAAGERYRARVEPAARNVLIKAGVAGVLGFVALLASLIVSVRVGRSLVRDLRTLRKEAQEVSGVRLPSVMRRLAAGEHVDVETEVPHLSYDRDEIGQVGQALNTLQRAAVEAAVKQADMRRGVSEVFVNLARRNQVLLHRQLTLLDAMERRTEDTAELADLFRIDHLTTRMRRHAEGLVILSGSAPSRQWRKPVQLMDVVRAAVAEVEDYERIEVRRLPRIGVGGPAVADLTHLLAELLENATVFSPPHTGVQVHGERVANGFTLEIHDRGLGMPPEAMLDANLRLAETPEFELSDTDRLGLFVVSRLAQRQNVRVSLQPSPYGGMTAIVFLPAALLTDAPDTEGTGFRLDRTGSRRTEADDRLTAPDPLPGGRTAERAGAGARPGRGEFRAANGDLLPRRTALSQLPSGRTGHHAPPVLDGPVELDAPVGSLGPDDRPEPPHGPAAHSQPPRGSTGLSGTEPFATGRPAPDGRVEGPSPRYRAGDPGDGPTPRIRTEAGGPPEAPYRGRPQLRPVPGRPTGDDDQHQQAADEHPAPHAADPDALPPRIAPVLVADHGRRLDGRSRPAPGADHSAGTPYGAGPGEHARRGHGEDATDPHRWPHHRDADASGPAAPPAPREQPPGEQSPSEDGAFLAGLPRRVRQANLAPQLRQTPAAGARPAASGPAAGADDDFERDAEEVRSRMAAMQRGWQRGRRQHAADPADPADPARTGATGPDGTAPGTTAPGNTSEGNGR